MKIPSILLSTFLSLAIGASGQSNPDVGAVSEGNTKFALKLYDQLNDEKGNLFLSPYSISTALSMTYAGARGDTEAEMAKALEFHLPQKRLHAGFSDLKLGLREAREKGGVELSIANALWPQKNYRFLPEYLNLIERDYDSVGRPLDYSNSEKARGIINKWVEQETNDKIKDLIPSGVLDSLTRMVLTNAIYFKGNWDVQFQEKSTREMPFKVTPTNLVKTPMMYQKGNFGYFQDDDVQVLEMPYKGEKVSMFVLLPNQGGGQPFRRPTNPPAKKKTLADLEKILSPDKLSEWIGKVRRTKVDTWFPKFKMTSEFSLSQQLQALGMKKAFGGADFSGMDGSKRLYLSAVLHKAFVEVNEEGTEAAAATAVVVRTRSARPMGPRFRADHPFIFLIRDKATGSILFLGRYADPSKGE
ncbi:MAG: proteinase inhibitor I4 serpin [Opitutae bacterium]|nr:proteinase inhibitor I4 serpin [Opitutae bacterium]|tara:strand:+ start:869 stop:2113 length:1245 start_codon:yes stop_codon:yes gene_type:complete